MRIVKKATIEIVTTDKLYIGDNILYSNLKCTVKNINVNARLLTLEKPNGSKVYVPYFSAYYRVISCEEVRICNYCGKEWRE